MNKRAIICAALAVCAIVSVCQAQIVTNGSFEEGFNGWTVSGAVDVETWTVTCSDGTNSARFNAAEASASGVVAQTFATVPGDRYLLQFDFGNWSPSGSSQQRLSVEVTGSGELLSKVVAASSDAAHMMSWVPNSFYFWTDSTNTTLTFRDVSYQTTSTDGHLDNVRVEYAGPALSIRVSHMEVCWPSKTNQLYQLQYRSTLTDTWPASVP